MSSTARMASLPASQPGNAGRLRVALAILRDLLRLPEGEDIAAARVIDGDVELLITGTDMPARRAGQEPERVDILLNRETQRTERGEEERVTAYWLHAPRATWVLQDWAVVPAQRGDR